MFPCQGASGLGLLSAAHEVVQQQALAAAWAGSSCCRVVCSILALFAPGNDNCWPLVQLVVWVLPLGKN
jgi:hypothetical protein